MDQKLLSDQREKVREKHKRLLAQPVENKDKLVKAMNLDKLTSNTKYMPIFTKKLKEDSPVKDLDRLNFDTSQTALIQSQLNDSHEEVKAAPVELKPSTPPKRMLDQDRRA